MVKVAFPSYDVQTINGRAGGIGSFIVHFARQLRAQGDEVTIIALQGRVDPEWRERYRSWGIELIEIQNEVAPERSPKIWSMTISEHLTPFLREFDIVYFSDVGGNAFNTVRMKRLGAALMPICVTVLHGSLNWVHLLEGNTLDLPDHLHHIFVEQYGARHSDHVIAPSRYMADWVRQEGWHLLREPEILGLPFIPLVHSPAAQGVEKLKRLIYFARLERRKGFGLFVDALLQLHRETPEVLAQLDEVVLLGHEDVPGASQWVHEELRPIGVPIIHIGNLDSRKAQSYLTAHVADSLVVVPSAFENFPYAVIEASLISGLNLIFTRGGGAPEIFSRRGDAQLFDPTPGGLSAKIRERLGRPLKPSELSQYDFAAHNDSWLKFHDRICATAHAGESVAALPITTRVDVCITYFNKARHFPHLLESLELQTFRNFRVIAVDDGSSAPNAAALFDYMADKYSDRGWSFIRQGRHSVNSSRNRAAERTDAEYLLFVDADDVLAADAIERLLQAALHSGVDCLTPGTLHFSGDQFPYDKRTGRRTTSIIRMNMPLGPALAGAVIEPSTLGNGVILIRRSVFEEVGGYQELAGAAHGDWALQVKLATAGYQTDVVPGYLHYYRQTGDDLSRNADLAQTGQRLMVQFDDALATVGLQGAASAMHFNLAMMRECKDHAEFLGHQLRLSHDRFNAFGFEPLAFAPAPASASAGSVVRSSLAPARPKKVLVVIPTLNIGGAEVDLLRNLPHLDGSEFEVVVFTFLSRGTLAARLAATGIEIVGPFVPFSSYWFGNLKRVVDAFVRKVTLLANRSVSRMRYFAARMAPEAARRAWRRLKLWIRSRRRSRRLRRLWEKLRDIRIAARRFWVKCRAELRTRFVRLVGYFRSLVRLLPRPLLRLFHEALAWTVYVLVGLVLVPFIRARRIDLIHTVLPNSYIVGSIANLWGSGRSLIMSRVGLNSYQQNHALRSFAERTLCHPNVSVAVGNCAAIVDELRDEGIPQSKLRLVRNGIDIADFAWQMVDREGARDSLDLPGSAIVISTVANLHAYKGHADLLRALHSVRHDMPEWILLAVGRDIDGNRARLEKLSDELEIRRRVRFLGERNDIPTILSAVDIHVSCSHMEGLPNNILEAMCAYLPVVATDVGGVSEVVVDRQTGTLVPPRDPVKLGQAILALAHAEGTRQRMGELGREHIAAHFAIDRSSDAWGRLYAEVVANGQQGDVLQGSPSAQDGYAP
jgi:glycosyltransferase involved in cell wall biosynthesis/GT2 family glycosyltransferase